MTRSKRSNKLSLLILLAVPVAWVLSPSSCFALSIALLNSPTGNPTFVANFQSFIEGEGHSFSRNPSSYDGVDIVFDIRLDGNQNLIDFVANGGLLVTEYSGTRWVLNTAQLLVGADTGGGLVGAGTPLAFTTEADDLGLSNLLSDPFSDGAATEFFRSISNLGPDVDIFATRGAGIPAIFGGAYGSGYILSLAFDWGDGFIPNTAGTQQLIRNVIATRSEVPEPASALLLFSALSGGALIRRNRQGSQSE